MLLALTLGVTLAASSSSEGAASNSEQVLRVEGDKGREGGEGREGRG